MKSSSEVRAFEPLESRQLLAAVKIMPLGDSITESSVGHASYRFWLNKQLTLAGYDIDFVGSLTGVSGGTPLYTDFDQNHEGRSGIRADQVQASIIGWATQNTPDIVLLHIGTNDVEQGQSNSSTINEISGIIDNLRSVKPNVKILLAQVIGSTIQPANIAALNSLIANLATTKNTAQSPVVLVDQYTGFNVSQDTYDGVHPNQQGEQKMANKWLAALTPMLPAPTPPAQGSTVYVSDMTPTAATNGWGFSERDRSNGESGGGDGNVIRLNAINYTKGLGVHALSDLTYNLAGLGVSEFRADVGVDDEVGSGGSVVFQVYVDGVKQYDSGTMTGPTATKSVVVPLNNNSTLRLVVTDGGNGNTSDHADWANARLVAGEPITPPAAPSLLAAVVNGNAIDLTWLDNSSDESGFSVERKIGAGGTYALLTTLGVGATSFTDSTASAGVTYFYRVYAIKPGANSGYSNEANATIPIAPGTTYVSDLPYVQNDNGWGNVEKDRSNGESGGNDGNTLTLNGVTYTKGLGTHARSEITVALNGQYSQFLSDIGVDDEVGNNGSVIFQVWLDGVKAFDSGIMTGSSATQQAVVNVSGATQMKLIVTDAGNGNGFDHADWANARLVAGEPITPPAAPSSLQATVNGNAIDLTWLDNSSDETGFRIERKIGAGGSYAMLTTLGVGATSFTDSTASAGATYFYHVCAIKTGANSGFSNEANATIPIAPGTTYVSDLPYVQNDNGWGNVEKDRSNGESGGNDGNTLTLNGVTYTKGLGTHARSEITVALNGQYSQFLSDIGVDDEVGNNGSVIFQVWLDGVKAFDSGIMTGSSATQQAVVNVSGATQMKLIVTDAGNGNGFDHADWANARLVVGAPITPPAAPSSLTATVNGNAIDLAWLDNSSDESGFRVERKTGAGGTYAPLTSLGVDATSFSDATAATGVTYFYRVYATKTGANSGFSNEATATIPVPPGIVYVSDLPFTQNANGWGNAERDRSNGETGSTDGNTINLNGVTYAKGIGVHAFSDITINLNGQYSQFLSDIGVDEESGNNGSIVFQVFLDNVKVFDSGTMTGASATQQVNVNVTGATTMRLVVTDAGNGNAFDHGDWAGARLSP